MTGISRASRKRRWAFTAKLRVREFLPQPAELCFHAAQQCNSGLTMTWSRLALLPTGVGQSNAGMESSTIQVPR